MQSMLVIKTKNGYAVAPYAGEIPADFVQNMQVAAKLQHYSYSTDTVISALEDFFEHEDAPEVIPEPLKVAA